MRSRTLFLVLGLVASPLLGGCTGQEQKKPAETTPTATITEQTGGIEGLVVTDEYLPIADAQVQLTAMNRTARTNDAGAFAFSELDPGSYKLVAGRLGYEQSEVTAEVVAGEITKVDIALIELPPPDPPIDTVTVFYGNLTLGTAAGGPDPVAEPVDTVNFPLPLLDRTPQGVLLAPVRVHLQLETTGDAAIDLDLYFLSPQGEVVKASTSGSPDEAILVEEVLAPGDYTVRVYFWAGALAQIEVTATVTYWQGERAQYAIDHPDDV